MLAQKGIDYRSLGKYRHLQRISLPCELSPLIIPLSLKMLGPWKHKAETCFGPTQLICQVATTTRQLGQLLLPNEIPVTAAAAATRTTTAAPFAPILIITLDHNHLGPQCNHNQWVLLMLISHRPSCGRLDCCDPFPRPLTRQHHITMPTGAIFNSRMSLPITEKQRTTGGTAYSAHPAFYIAYEPLSLALLVVPYS